MHPVIVPGDPMQPPFVLRGDPVQRWLDQTQGAGFAAGALAHPKPKRSRQRSLTTILRQARKAGADRVVIGGAVVYLNPTPGEGPPAAPTEAADNSWDDLLLPGGRNATH
jgi:hypothetical protein